jgi:hypothetical protein
MRLIYELIKNNNYTPQKGSKTMEEATKARHLLDTELFVNDFALACAQVLVSRYIPLQEEDLEMWRDDPETWLADDEAEQWEFQLRVSRFICISYVYILMVD